MLVIGAGIHKMPFRIAYSEDDDQSSLIWVCTVCQPFKQATNVQYFRTFLVIRDITWWFGYKGERFQDQS